VIVQDRTNDNGDITAGAGACASASSDSTVGKFELVHDADGGSEVDARVTIVLLEPATLTITRGARRSDGMLRAYRQMPPDVSIPINHESMALNISDGQVVAG
jgi:hypothetical protein